MIGNLVKGGLWQLAADGVKLVVNWFGKLRDKIKEAEEAEKKYHMNTIALETRMLGDLAKAQEKMSQARRKAIDESSKAYKAEIDSVHELTKAMLELERARARKNGDKGSVAAIEAEIDAAGAEATRKKLERDISDAKARLENASRKWSAIGTSIANANRIIRESRYDLTYETDADTRKALHKAIGKAYVSRDKFRNDRSRAFEEYEKEKQRVEEAKRALSAFEIREQAKVENAEADAREKDEEARKKEAEDIKKFNAEKARLEKSIAEERKRLEREVAAEREKREREAHQKRMEDLRKEIAAQKSAASVMTSRAASAQSEFDKAFAMYRDPSRAAAEIGEEKDYRSDLDRLHRDARRYGAKWRIAELSSLMAAGDTRGVSDTLAEWRKGKGFTPEVEAMVRASAAENAKTTVEDELRKIEANTAGLGEKLEQLLAMKGGS
jgi:hypothetical protein